MKNLNILSKMAFVLLLVTAISRPTAFAQTASVSGTILNDKNGNTDGLVNGTPQGFGSTRIYVSLYNPDSEMVNYVTTLQEDGTFKFSGVASGVYKVTASMLPSSEGLLFPRPVFPDNLFLTGSPNINIVSGADSLLNQNIGVMQAPIAKKIEYLYPQNVESSDKSKISLAAKPLSFTNANGETVSAGGQFEITTVPSNDFTLYYNGARLRAGSIINSFNKNLFSVEPPFYDQSGSVSTDFTYKAIYSGVKSETAEYIFNANFITGTLGVVFQSFELKNSGSNVEIYWQTGIEVNVDFFEIERKGEKEKAFTGIVKINSKGSNSAYSYEDRSSAAGTQQQYRLKVVDNDGSISYSQVKSIEINRRNKKVVKLYPSPADSYVVIEGYSGSVVIYDVSGKKVLAVKTATGRIDISTLAPGIYFVKAGEESLKFVKKG